MQSHFPVLCSLLLIAPVFGAQEAEKPLGQEDLRRARGELDSRPVSDAQLQHLLGECSKALREFEGGDGRQPLAERASELEQRLATTRNESLMGRWLGTSSNATLAWLAFPPTREFETARIVELGKSVVASCKKLQELAGIEQPARTGKRAHAAAEKAEELLAVFKRVDAEQKKRAAFLARYEAEWTKVPLANRRAYANEPTLGTALKARLGLVLAQAYAKEQSMIEELEVRVAERRAKGVAEAHAEKLMLKLAQERKMSKLTHALLDAEFQVDVERQLSRLQRTEEKSALIAKDRSKRTAELELALQKADKSIKSLRDQVELMKREQKIKQLPPEVLGRVRILTTPGTWRPELIKSCEFSPRAVYETKQPHSLSALAAAGCLDESPNGLWALYLVLALPGDTERPRFRSPVWPVGYNWNPYGILQVLENNRYAHKTLKAIQQTLRRHGEDLVKLGHLKP